MKSNFKDILILLRMHQYVKNFFIFVPLFFAGEVTNLDLLGRAILAFVGFSFTASAIYILNDYLDIEEDRKHPEKKYRPLASGSVSPGLARVLMGIFLITGVILTGILSLETLAVIAIYVCINFAYSFRLKHVALLDITIIAVGFILRLFVGSVVTGVSLSMWIVIMTFLLALFIALAKRRDDILIFLDTGNKMRKSVDGYNLQLIDGSMVITASVVIVTYILYTVSSEIMTRLNSEYLYLTTLFVVFGILRYLQIAWVEKRSGSPTKIVLKDIVLQLTIGAWLLSFGWMIYL